MRSESLVIAGLPSSGKTTFLAALWHQISSFDGGTRLSLGKLTHGDITHLNEIAKRWRGALVQERTPVNRRVGMQLLDAAGQPIEMHFPDVFGEAFTRMWEDRECDPDLVPMLQAKSVALFIHSDEIVLPRWIIEDAALAQQIGLQPERKPEPPVPWSPAGSPTQVQLVDILQLLQLPPLGIGKRKIAIMLSAWDLSEGEQLTPDAFLKSKLPLLDQYLKQNRELWQRRVYGVSAQGGTYDDPSDPKKPQSPEAEQLRGLDRPADRIRVVRDGGVGNDLTEPLEWLTS